MFEVNIVERGLLVFGAAIDALEVLVLSWTVARRARTGGDMNESLI